MHRGVSHGILRGIGSEAVMIGCRPLSTAEIEALRGALEAVRDRTLLTLGVKTGFRISELLSLKVQDVRQHGTIVDRVTVARRCMKGRHTSRTVALHGEARQAIAELLETGLEDRHYLFKSRQLANRPLSACQAWRILKRAANACKLQGRVATHNMRKTFARGIYERTDRDLLKTAQALGHKSVSSTVSYLSCEQADVDAAILGG